MGDDQERGRRGDGGEQGRQTAIVRLGRGGEGGAIGRGSSDRTSPHTFTVNSTANTATGGCNATQCTLTEAVNEANGNGESDLRNTPYQGEFSILNDAPAMYLTIQGSGARALAVNGNDETRAFGIAAGANAAIKSLVIKHGRATGIDGGIRNTGTLALTNSTASSSTTNGQDGGILNGGSPGGPVLPTSTIIAGNTSGSAGWGSSDLLNSNPLLGPYRATVAPRIPMPCGREAPPSTPSLGPPTDAARISQPTSGL